MKRLHPEKIDDAKYYEHIWGEEENLRPFFDAVRMRALVKHVKDGDKVMDVGAGVFGACQYLAEHTEIKAKLFCLDQSHTAKEIVSKEYPQIDFTVSSFEPPKKLFPFKDETFDVVTAGEIIEHMEDPAAFAKELCRITKQHGWVTLSTVDTNCENAIKHGDYPEHLWEFTPEDLISFFKPYGETEYHVVGDYHFIYCRLR